MTRSTAARRSPWPAARSPGPTSTTPRGSTWPDRSTLGRPASAAEVDRARAYLADFEPVARAVLAAPPAAEGPSIIVASPTPAADAKPTPVLDPDQVVLDDAPITEEVIRPADARAAAAWASLCQALLGSAEFRHLR